MNIGDRIRVDGITGIVVAVISEGKYSTAFPAEDWAYLKVGVLVDTVEAGLIHFPNVDRIEIEARAE